ncbi:MAG: AAA family ATPase [Alphaproteobacteria bacterium]
MSLSITNKEFLAALREPGDNAGIIPDDAIQWVCHFPPTQENWRGEIYTKRKSIEFPKENTYFSISMLRPVDGVLDRKKDNFFAMLCIVLDDIGTKAQIPSLEPSWRLETSPGNEQWGYILKTPITDPEEAYRVVKAIIAAGYCDKGAGGPATRYMRLPVGSNGKAEHMAKNGGKPVPHVLQIWKPEKHFSLDEIIDALDLKFHENTSNADIESVNGDCTDLFQERIDDNELIRQICAGENYHDATLTLSARYFSRGMGRKAIIETVQGFMMASGDDSDRWKVRYKDIPRLVDGAIQKFQETHVEDISFVDFSSLATTQPPPRQWIVPEWLPRGTLTLLAGAGGVGKSLLAQQLATCVANGFNWMGLETTQGNVLGFFCEDDNDELLRRAHNIFFTGLYDAEKASERLYLDARAGKYNTLATFGSDRQIQPTALLDQIHEQCQKIKPVLLILDNVAQMYAGAEIDRVQVTAFCNALTEIALKYNCAVLLLAHPAKAEGSEFSGSTAWEAAVRTRLFLKRNDDDTLTIKKAKANYSALDDINIRYQDGAFTLHLPGDELPETLQEAEALIIQAIETYTNRENTCSHTPTARNYIVRQMKSDNLLGEFTVKKIERALNNLLDKKKLIPNSKLPWKNASRHVAQGLAINIDNVDYECGVSAASLSCEADINKTAIAQGGAAHSLPI